MVKVGKGNRKVTFYAEQLTITDATFHTGPVGRVCNSGHKNRHNYVQGKLASFSGTPRRPGTTPAGTHTATYTPGTHNTYMTDWQGEQKPVTNARRVEFTFCGSTYVPCTQDVCGELGVY